ncbi:MAG: glycosyltransferase [Chloroflexi bacterium]|nr:glycosyltransferase [Chloroflexota bacterium]
MGHGDANLPRISIVTPSFNQAAFIEETLRSVLLQSYPNLEYIVVDGGSTDGSVEIIRRYERWLTWWVSEPDRGQAHALNKGFARATGDLVAWINSDDRYLPNAFARVAETFRQNPAAGLVFGKIELLLDDRAQVIGYPTRAERMLDELVLPYQPACFFARAVLQRVGALNEALAYALDADLLVRVMANADCIGVPDALASFRVQAASKTSTAEAKFAAELLAILDAVLAQRAAYPKWQTRDARELQSIFYRRASKHLYMGNRFSASLRLIILAARRNPRATWSIAQDEGIGWLTRRALPPGIYRKLSASVRARN